jgi:staphylococcal nuclease domain-containing protein 1
MTEPGESYPELPLLEGWVKLRDDASRKAEDTPVYKSLVERCELEEAKAKAESKGVWSGPAPELTLQHDIPDVKAFAEEWKDKGIEAIVERVLTGDRLLMRLLISDTKHIQTVIIMAGIRAPSTKRTNANGLITPAEPFGEEAQEFIDVRIMLRKLTCTIVGVSPQNQLICKTHHFKFGDIADYILRDGLARVNDHHSTMLGAKSMARLRHFEGEAKEAKRNLFEGHVARANVPGVDVTVSRVQSADTIYVRSKDGTEKRVNLSSVRQPKPGDPEQAPFQAEAKEFARKKLIGKHVRLTIDGKKAASEGFEEREVASIFHNDKNFSLLLVENGYASVIRHRRDDSKVCPVAC